ncbi:SIR2 family protein [Maritalea porphyrae]|uniref:SIR2 family protein n=1 Tax=Maritalea porphyrae TaxID=880732 RepID=UPI0024E06705|nr:SIR2 family protein [Maritalea porphyrae]
MNFLIGSGASHGLFPTLALAIKNSQTGKNHTFETLVTKFEKNKVLKSLLFSWYVEKVIKPATQFDIELLSLLGSDVEDEVIANYEKFMSSVLTLLSRKSYLNRANVFTTNYDGMIAHVAEKMLRNGTADFVLNDGGTGFIKRTLDAKSFNRTYQDHGVFDRHAKSVPQVNLIQMHGSVYWYKDGDRIEISYRRQHAVDRIDDVPMLDCSELGKLLGDEQKSDEDLLKLQVEYDTDVIDLFWEKYEQLPVVNPTKWKFHETVFEEHYYQMLRLLSYELEKPNTVFIIFGFSFADEHILNLVKRSLSNPSLKLFICCFNDKDREELNAKFEIFPNVELVSLDGDLNFTRFNYEVFAVGEAASVNAT